MTRGDQAANGRDERPLDHLIWSIGRAYQAYVGLLELILAETGLDRYLSPGMGPVLFALFAEDECSIKRIGAQVQLSGSTLTGLLVRMERAGLIERRRDVRDGRVTRIRLTPLARSLEPRCRQALTAFDDTLRTGLGARGMRQARQLLEGLIETLRDEQRRRQAPQHATKRNATNGPET